MSKESEALVRSTLKLALEALESFVQPNSCEHGYWWEDCPNDACEKVKDMKAITAIKEALMSVPDVAQPEFTTMVEASNHAGSDEKTLEKQPIHHHANLPLAQPAVGEDIRSSAATLCRAWVGLTDEDIKEIRTAFVKYIKNGQDEYSAFDFAFDDYKAAHGIIEEKNGYA